MWMLVTVAFGCFIGTAIHHLVTHYCGKVANLILLTAVMVAIAGLYFGVIK